MARKLKYDMPPNRKQKTDLLQYGIFGTHIEIFEDRLLSVEGCRGVCDYTDCYIRLKIKKGDLAIYGTLLQILTFEGEDITIGGRVRQIEFCFAGEQYA